MPLHLVIVGHVDHGKSSLIGRILYDTQSVEPSRVEKIRRICEEQHKPFELAFLLDALEEEQLQGITIDTTQIRFHTPARDFVIIDAPGHKEFLKNMISGAAKADAAVLIIDAREGVREQSRRHGYLLSLLGVRNIVVVINKMDLVDFDQAAFERVRDEYLAFLSEIGVEPLQVIPLSAFTGDNVTTRSAKMPWYEGESFLGSLERFASPEKQAVDTLRMTVQDVYKFDDRRIVAGRIHSGALAVGDTIQALPSGHQATVLSIETWPSPETPITRVEAGYNAGITLDYQLFLDRGHVLTHPGQGPEPTRYVAANVFWMAPRPLTLGQRVKLKIGAQEAVATVHQIKRVMNSSTMELLPGADGVPRNDVGEVVFRAEQPMVADVYGAFTHTARLVIVDGYDVCGGGIVLATGLKGLNAARGNVQRSEREGANGHRAALIAFDSDASHPRERDSLMRQLERALFDAGLRVSVASAAPGQTQASAGVIAALLEAGQAVLVAKGAFPDDLSPDLTASALSVDLRAHEAALPLAPQLAQASKRLKDALQLSDAASDARRGDLGASLF